jgi:hypothetical protein
MVRGAAVTPPYSVREPLCVSETREVAAEHS